MTTLIALGLSATLALTVYGAAYALGGPLALLGVLAFLAAGLTWCYATAGDAL